MHGHRGALTLEHNRVCQAIVLKSSTTVLLVHTSHYVILELVTLFTSTCWASVTWHRDCPGCIGIILSWTVVATFYDIVLATSITHKLPYSLSIVGRTAVQSKDDVCDLFCMLMWILPKCVINRIKRYGAKSAQPTRGSKKHTFLVSVFYNVTLQVIILIHSNNV